MATNLDTLYELAERMKQVITPCYAVHNASPVFCGKNVALVLQKPVAEMLASWANAESKYKSTIYETSAKQVNYHDGWATEYLPYSSCGKEGAVMKVLLDSLREIESINSASSLLASVALAEAAKIMEETNAN